jgi:hypothetical protein
MIEAKSDMNQQIRTESCLGQDQDIDPGSPGRGTSRRGSGQEAKVWEQTLGYVSGSRCRLFKKPGAESGVQDSVVQISIFKGVRFLAQHS